MDFRRRRTNSPVGIEKHMGPRSSGDSNILAEAKRVADKIILSLERLIGTVACYGIHMPPILHHHRLIERKDFQVDVSLPPAALV
jgi:hypothetical protein